MRVTSRVSNPAIPMFEQRLCGADSGPGLLAGEGWGHLV
jgi:hypothetical protein